MARMCARELGCAGEAGVCWAGDWCGDREERSEVAAGADRERK